MVGRSCSQVARALVIGGAIAGAVFASGNARASNRYGIFPHHVGPEGSSPLGGGTDTQCGVITYCGGPVISNVQIVPVYWTSGVSASVTDWVPNYVKTITNSTFMDMLSEYSTKGKTSEVCGMLVDGGMQYVGPSTPTSTNQTVTRGTATAAVTITPTVTTGSSITDDNGAIGDELVAQIAAGKLQAPTYDAEGYPNTIYFVFFPSNYSISIQGGSSCTGGGFAGYHFSHDYPAGASCFGSYIPYAVIPDCGRELSAVVSHELAEAVSDTNVGSTAAYPNSELGWYLGPDNAAGNGPTPPPDCGEVGDVCDNQGTTTVTGTSIAAQYIWSQAQQGGSCQIDNASFGVKAGPTGTPVTKCLTAPPPVVDAGTDGGNHGGADSGVLADSGGATTPDATVGPNPQGDGGGTTIPVPDSGPSGGPVAADDAGLGGNGDTGGGGLGASSGCGCKITETRTSSGVGAFGALFAIGLVARARRRRMAG